MSHGRGSCGRPVGALADEFPSDLLAPDELERAIAFIRALPLTMPEKRKKLRDWSRLVDLTVPPAYYGRLMGGPTRIGAV